jgi:predicted metal-dependent phosphoesterase TrpH
MPFQHKLKTVKNRKADLHMHTKASDGTDTLEKRTEDAKEKGLNAIAVTDHDTVNEGLEKRSFKAKNGIEVITGSEIKCRVKGEKIEILAYFLDPEETEVKELFEELSDRREKRMKEFVENLNEAHGLGLEIEELLEKADGNVGRPHLAETIVEKGVVDSHQEAFDRFIGSEHDEYVAVEKVSAEKVIEAVHENGGVTSLAHPGRSLTESGAEEIVKELKSKGLDGLEVEYTYKQKKGLDSYTINFGTEKASELAEEFDLVKTGGSDCHGSGSEKYFLGDVKVPYSRVNELKNMSGK